MVIDDPTDDPTEAGRKLAETLRPFFAAGGVIHVGPRNVASTSAQLRETQAAYAQAQRSLAAAQADLTAMERERDEALHELAHAKFQVDIERTKLENVRELWAEARAEIERLRGES